MTSSMQVAQDGRGVSAAVAKSDPTSYSHARRGSIDKLEHSGVCLSRPDSLVPCLC